MNKENFLFGTIGLLAGLIIGFMFANSVNRNMAMPVSTAGLSQNSTIPAGHPEITGDNPTSSAPIANVPEVQAAIEKAKNEPNNFEAQTKAAELFYQIERYDGAAEYLKQANKLKPDNYEVITQLGNTYFDSNKFEEAEKWYSNALNKKSDDVNVRTDLGLTFLLRQPPNYDRAILEFKRSLETDPKHIKTMQNLIVAYTKKGELANAKATLAKLESLEPANLALPKLREEISKIGS